MRVRRVRHIRRCFIGWRLVGNSVIDDRRRRLVLVIRGFLFLALLLHIIRRLRGGVEIQCVFVAVPHNEIPCRQQIINGAAIAAVGDAEGILNCHGAERIVELVLVAAQVKIQSEGNAGGQFDKGFLPFVNGDLNEIAPVFGFVDCNNPLVRE